MIPTDDNGKENQDVNMNMLEKIMSNCPHCGLLKFSKAYKCGVMPHIKNEHWDETHLRCPFCEEVCLDYPLLESHTRKVHKWVWDKSYESQENPTDDKGKENQEVNLKLLGRIMSKCPHCGLLKFNKAYNSGMMPHIKYKHFELTQLSCPYCGEVYPNYPSLKNHTREEHKWVWDVKDWHWNNKRIQILDSISDRSDEKSKVLSEEKSDVNSEENVNYEDNTNVKSDDNSNVSSEENSNVKSDERSDKIEVEECQVRGQGLDSICGKSAADWAEHMQLWNKPVSAEDLASIKWSLSWTEDDTWQFLSQVLHSSKNSDDQEMSFKSVTGTDCV